MSYIVKKLKRYFQVPDFKNKFSLHKFGATAEKPYGSRALAKKTEVAHKVIHRFCGQTLGGDGRNPPASAACHLRTHGFLNVIKDFDVYQRPCAQSYPHKVCRTPRALEHRLPKEDGASPEAVKPSTKPGSALFLRNRKIAI
jgi:hypothetical protein